MIGKYWQLLYFTVFTSAPGGLLESWVLEDNHHIEILNISTRDGGLEDRPQSRGRPRDHILMASVLVSDAHVSVSVLVSEVPDLSIRSRELASVLRPASRPYFDGLGLGLGLGCPCLGLGLGLGGPGFVYRVSRTGLGLEAGLET